MAQSCCSKQENKAPKLAEKITLYRPLIIFTVISIFAASILALTGSVPMMNGAMGFFLCFLASLKLLNLQGFAESFSQYDILAKRSSFYAYSYPFIELSLAGLYFSGLYPIFTNSLMLLIMGIGSIGVLQIITSGRSVQCACVGSTFNLPVGKVTLFENMVMAAMAASMLGSLLI